MELVKLINFSSFYFMFKSKDQYLYTQYYNDTPNIDWSLFLYDQDNTIQKYSINFREKFKGEINERRKYLQM